MQDEERPDPEELLKIVRRAESQRQRGKLKIFLGMAAGVGKTYSMLEAAKKQQQDGVNVVIGIVETHGRQETAQLMSGIPFIPPKILKYKDANFPELDIDEVIAKKPELILIDELAHSNVAGCRHPKRWQDVAEILDNGIDVYTTLNVQHIESLKDVVEGIAGIAIRETVPDLVIETATSIELIDLTPDELLRRLKDGKVYLGDQTAIAVRNFFQEDRLTALREIALRYAAEKVDHDLHGMFATGERLNPWKPRERLLVAVNHSPHSQKVIRITRRLAFNLDAPWIALYVDMGLALNSEAEEMLAKNLALARDLGAEVVMTAGADLAQTIRRVARQKSVTQIIIGRSPMRWAWIPSFLQKSSLFDRLAYECADLDIHVIRQALFTPSARKKLSLSDNLSTYTFISLYVFLCSSVSWLFLDYLGYRIVGYAFLFGISFLSLFAKQGAILFGALLFALSWSLLFIPALHFLGTEELILILFFFMTAAFTGILTTRARKNQEVLEKREKSIETLYEIVKEISQSSSLDALLPAIKERLDAVLQGKCEIIPKKIDNGLIFENYGNLAENEKEKAAAIWVFQNGKEAGWSTSTLPFAQFLYIPLVASKEVVGVLAFRSRRDKTPNIEEKNFLYTVAHQLASYLERQFSEQHARKLEHHKQVEKIYQSILHLIASLFEAPLLIIKEEIKALKQQEAISISKKDDIEPIARIEQASDDLSHILDNILAMVNLSAGLTPVYKAKHDIKNLITICCDRISKMKENLTWKIDIERNLPELSFDYDLIELLFYNLTFHAIEFAKPNTPIEIEAKRSGSYAMISISDQGQSIPVDMLDVAFEKFYRMPGSSASGLGLGLAIAQAIAEIHHGHLKIQNRQEGGMTFALFLPLMET